LDVGLVHMPPTLDCFTANIAAAGLADIVRVRQGRAVEVAWEGPIGLLVIDGLHDYASVAEDFSSFEASVIAGGFVAFHDCADHFPGVKAFISDILRDGQYEQTAQAGSLVVVRKVTPR